MKIAHLADIHLSELAGPVKDGQNARMLDTIRCMDYAFDKLNEEQPDIILIAGDLFHKSKLWADEMLKEITIAANWLRRLTSIAPTVLLFGTANHDNMKAFENIRDMSIPWLTVVTEPDFLEINTKSGDIQIVAVPGMDKGFFRTLFPGMDMEDENKAISEALGNVIMGISAEAKTDIPCVLMAHYTVTGCELENGESIFLNSDIVIPTAALQASSYDLVCLGHIHKAQEVPNCGRPVYYSGPLNGITFNEEGQDKGFWIHELAVSAPYNRCVGSNFIKTPSREFLTLKWVQQHIEFFMCNGIPQGDIENIKDKIVRVIYSCADETNKRFNKKVLEKAMYEAGAFYVSEIRPSKILTVTDKNTMSENDSVENNLRVWLEKQDTPPDNIAEIIETARPMIAEINASLPTGKLTGVFEPVSLEVKNYRSYKDESFDFTQVNFATVNGPNGIGKSSFFMDAVADCLFEEPREGELTGWISNGDDVKSGAMTFTFWMGEDTWRVIRTRVKSGKTTLSLQKQDKGEWKDQSCDKKDDTQKKIVNLLGMDSMTFKSCALIMQDNYGLFLEADKTDRMQVLGNILGLSVYDKLHDLAKDKLRIQNRGIENLKYEISLLDEKLALKETLEKNLENSLEEKRIVDEKLWDQEVELKVVKSKLEKTKELISQRSVIEEKVLTLRNDKDSKENEIAVVKADIERAQKIVSQEDKILAKIQEYEDTKTKITTLRAQQPILTQKQAELRKTKMEIVNLQDKIRSNDRAITAINEELKEKEQLEKEVADLPDYEAKLIEFEQRKEELEKLLKGLETLKQKWLSSDEEYKRKSELINFHLSQYKEKTGLINNSNCPVENPSCSFLEDALAAKSKIPELEKELSDLDYCQVQDAKAAYEGAKVRYQEFGYNREGHENLKTVIEILKDRKIKLAGLSGKDELLRNYINQNQDYKTSIEALEEDILRLQPEIKSLTEVISCLPELEAAMPKLEQWYRGKDELPAAKQIIISSNDRLQNLQDDVNKNIEEGTKLTEKWKELDHEIFSIEVKDTDLILTESNIKILNDELNNIGVVIGITQAKIDELSGFAEERTSKTELNKQYAKAASTLTLLSQAFSIDGVPFQIVRSVVAELSSKSNEILSRMTGGKMSIEFKMDKVLKNKKEVNALEIWINDYQRGTMPYLSRSGGQKVKAALSVAFALADLKANRAGIQLGMMFIDEPPFLDAEGVQAYADALELMHDQYNSMKVIAISHDPTMKARFPQSIDVVDAGDDGSKITFNG